MLRSFAASQATTIVRSCVDSQVVTVVAAVSWGPHRTRRHLADSVFNSVGGTVGISGSLTMSPPLAAVDHQVEQGAESG